jgi:hypothetical protein
VGELEASIQTNLDWDKEVTLAAGESALGWLGIPAGDTWSDVCEILGIESLEEQERYYRQLKTQCRMGNEAKFKKEKGAYFFPNPIRWQRYPARYGQTGAHGKQWEFPKGLTFPKLKPLAAVADNGSEEQNNLLIEQESKDIECDVYLDWKQHNQESLGIEEWEEQKLFLQKAADSAGMEVHWATAEQEHYNDPRTGLPIAPKTVRALIKRGKQAEQEKWWAAISKELDGLKEKGVFQMMTYRELVAQGYVTDKIKPVPLRMLLNTKIKPSGEFDKAKARYVLQGDPQHLQKGVHFSVVFAPTPGLETGRILQAYAVGNNKSRFAFDINQALEAVEPESVEPEAVEPESVEPAAESVEPAAESVEPAVESVEPAVEYVELVKKKKKKKKKKKDQVEEVDIVVVGQHKKRRFR